MPQDPEIFQIFADSLGGRDPKTVAAYLSVLRGFTQWLSEQTGSKAFSIESFTETAIRGYLNTMVAAGRAPQTRGKALTALRRFCRWAMGEGLMNRNPANQIERPTIVATAPRELEDDQRFILKNLVERQKSCRLSAIFALGYWAGMRVSEIARLRLDQCDINQRAGSLVIANAKGGKTRTIDLHNMARRALYTYVYEDKHGSDARDPESEYLFTGQRSAWMRRRGRPDHLSARGIQLLWDKLKQQAAQEEWEHIKNIRFHDLRHDFAHRARAAGWQLEEIAVYLGHQTKEGMPAIASTVRYTLPSRKQLKAKLKHLI